MRYELLLQSRVPGEPFDAARVEAAFATRTFHQRSDGERRWRLQRGDVELRPLVEGGQRIATELRIPLGGDGEFVRDVVTEAAAIARESETRLFDPQLAREVGEGDGAAVADQYLRTARYAGEMAGVSEAIGVGMPATEDGLKPGTKVFLGLIGFFAVVFALLEALG